MKLPGPDHPITIARHSGRVVVRFSGEIMADTRNALELKEASYKPVFYIPRADAMMDKYEASDRRTHCPYKGDASYFHLKSNGTRGDNAVWSYEAPFPAMKEIEGYVAFYPDKVTIEAE
jgi:uncharacterized protein (DUF427 family)